MKKPRKDFKRTTVVHPYGYSMSVVFTDDINRATRKIMGDQALRYPQCARARHIYDAQAPQSVLIFFRDVTLSDIVHESFHVTHRIFELLGHDISAGAHEPHAWLIEWVFEWVRKQAKKAGLKPR